MTNKPAIGLTIATALVNVLTAIVDAHVVTALMAVVICALALQIVALHMRAG